MKNSTRFAVLVLTVLAGGAGSALAGGDRMGGTGLYLTRSAETLAPGEMKPKVQNKDARGMAFNRRVVLSAL